MAFQSSRVNFTGQQGQSLAARLETPNGKVLAYALFAHCFTCSKDIFAATRIARGLAEQGIATLRFDFTGLGQSEGDFANENFSSNVEDLVAAAAHMREALEAPSILIGHSLGGAAVLAAAGQIPELKAVATIGAPADPAHVSHLFESDIGTIEKEGEANVQLFGRPFTVKKHFLEDVAQQNQMERIGSLKKALLVMHAPLDATVGIDNAAAIFTAAKHPKSFISLDGADHLLTRQADAEYAADVLAAWAGRWVGRKGEETTGVRAKEGQAVVTESDGFKFRQVMSVGPHGLIADEPVSVGGADSGPTPYGFLLAGLGACTSMTIRMYADRKGIALENVRVDLSHDKIHAEDCENCETDSGKIDKITRTVYLTGSLSEEERQKLLEIADKCPVHRTLHSEVLIETELSEG